MFSEDKSTERLYKYKELKVYSSTEWLANNEKKYRQVFDQNQTSYIYSELSFINKLFDRDSWEIEVELRCYRLEVTPKLVCELDFSKKVSKYDHVVYIREGWGNKKDGTFWKKGVYYWEAYLNKEKVGTKYFYVENGESSETGNDEYFSVESMGLFEGQYDAPPDVEKTYHKIFSSDQTRYIYADITLKNLLTVPLWHLELFVKFYNEARELKGQINKLIKVKNQDTIIEFSAGWGSNTPGSWRKGKYTMEIIFLDKLVAVCHFELADHFEEGSVELITPVKNDTEFEYLKTLENYSFDQLFEKLDDLIGLSHIKQKVKDHALYLQFIRLRKERGIEKGSHEDLHSVFVGNPGTGKTTVAKMLGVLYKKMGLLSKGHVIEVDRVDLVGEYIGQTAPKVKEVIAKARGGILFIDEAYSLARAKDDTKDFGREVIEILIKEMSNGEGDLSVIVAGYPKEMEYFIESNPGIKSRFKQYFEFHDYMPQELSTIAEYAADQKDVVFNKEAKHKINGLILEAYRNRDRSFGNARYIYDLVENAKVNLGLRVMKSAVPEDSTNEELRIIIKSDIEMLEIGFDKERPKIPVDEPLLSTALEELQALIGLEDIKGQINDLIKVIRYYNRTKQDVLNNFFLHTVLVGNAGTGKTTIARILAKIYKALGLLERGHLVETDRQGLVSGYVGQTAIKTTEKVEEALGGILFIDEAYSLTSQRMGGNGDFGGEAIQTLLKRMEDYRGKFFVIVAGYPDNMENFLKANPGFKSRFDKTLHFKDYTQENLLQIALKILNEKEYACNPEAELMLVDLIRKTYLMKGKHFGNAREVRKLMLELIKQQNVRLSEIKDIDLNDIRLFKSEDFKTLEKVLSKEQFDIKKIGF